MKDQWYFKIGDGQTYGPFPLAQLQKWASSGDLMPTHRVRHVDSDDWVIAAYVQGLEGTVSSPAAQEADVKATKGRRSLGLRRKAAAAKDAAAEAPAGKLPPNATEACDEILRQAFVRRASDVHIDPEENVVLVQLRVDGALEAYCKYPKSMHGAVMGRLKVMAGMDIAERREAQDGRFTRELGDEKRRIDIRAAVLPTTQGERITLRLLAVDTGRLTLHRLGMSDKGRALMVDALAESQGLVLVTGPTGSGKSTTLYASVRHRLATDPGRIITVEDPVEFDIIGVSQVEVDTADKVAFGTVLRNILRSDPDVVMIGEMRDYESASIGVKAALTGHLVLSSLHTNSAVGAVTRLVDMGVEPFLVAATVRLCVSQRLLRRVCPKCRTPRKLTQEEAAGLGRPDAVGATVFDAAGCDECAGRGYKGRVGVYEMFVVGNQVRRLITDNVGETEIAEAGYGAGGIRMRDDAVDKLVGGLTTMEEVVAGGAARSD